MFPIWKRCCGLCRFWNRMKAGRLLLPFLKKKGYILMYARFQVTVPSCTGQCMFPGIECRRSKKIFTFLRFDVKKMKQNFPALYLLKKEDRPFTGYLCRMR